MMIKSGKVSARKSKRGAPGLILSTVAWDMRFLWGLALELRPHNIATVALAPGFMRTERVMSYANGEADWKKVPWLKDSESPEYSRGAVAALAPDRSLMRRSGKALHVGELARQYGFTDIDGRTVPEFIMREQFVDMVKNFQQQNS